MMTQSNQDYIYGNVAVKRDMNWSDEACASLAHDRSFTCITSTYDEREMSFAYQLKYGTLSGLKDRPGMSSIVLGTAVCSVLAALIAVI